MQHHVLIVEDEPDIAEMIKMSLENNGFHTSHVDSIAAARVLLGSEKVDLALVDWMLPGGSGIELVRFLRKNEVTKLLPVIMLTAKAEESDVTAGLDAGADDYITKPFSPRELNSRIKALLRRSHAALDETLQTGRLLCNTSNHRVSVDGKTLALGATEFNLLQFLMSRPERVFSRAQLLDHVWGPGTFIEERTVDVHILRLRKALKPYQLDSLIQTVRGAGYRFSDQD